MEESGNASSIFDLRTGLIETIFRDDTEANLL